MAMIAATTLVGCFATHTTERDAGTAFDAGSSMRDAASEVLRPEEFGEAYRRARCRRAARCEGYSGFWASEIAEWCHPRSRESMYSWPEIPRFDGACEPEWQDYSPEVARRCIAALESSDCHRDYGEPELICGDVFIRQPLWPEGSCAPHRCPEGELCTIIAGCADFYCPRACRPPLGEGEVCLETGGPWPDDCAEGLRCWGSGVIGGLGTCVRLRGEGEPCDASAPCHEDSFCIEGACQLWTGTTGGPCRSDCRGDDFCLLQEDGQRRCIPGAAIGAACSELCLLDEVCEAPPCGPGARCLEGVCVRTVHEGEPCGADAACILSFHCESGRCVADPVEGEPCSEAIPCARGVCDGGRCRLREPGERCDFLRGSPLGECPSGEHGCDYDTGTCRAALREGEPCAHDPLSCTAPLVCDYFDRTCEVDDSCWCRGFCAPAEP